MEASHLPDTEFKTLVIRLFNELRTKTDDLRENLHKELETMGKNKLKVRNIVTGMNNSLGGLNSTLDEAEAHISNLEDKAAENHQSEQQKEFKKKKRIV